MRSIIITLLILAGTFGVSTCLKCYVCYDCAQNTEVLNECSDLFGVDVDSENCMKTVLSNGLIVKSCGIPCISKELEEDDCVEHSGAHVCLCSGNQCNSATKVYTGSFLLTAAVLIAIQINA